MNKKCLSENVVKEEEEKKEGFPEGVNSSTTLHKDVWFVTLSIFGNKKVVQLVQMTYLVQLDIDTN